MISQQEFIARQHRLLALCEPESVVIVPAGRLQTRSRDTEYPFRQDSDFWYLTGFGEPESVLLLSNHSQFSDPYRAMGFRPKDKTAEIWQGRRLGAEAGLSAFALDEAFVLDELDDILAEWFAGHDHVYFPFYHPSDVSEKVHTVCKRLARSPKENLAPGALRDISPLIHEMRLYKSACEVALMKAAGKISAQGHVRAMKFAHPGCFEYQLEAELHHEFAMSGARHPAYGTIVGGGNNACILHYTENSDVISDGDLILIDAGAEYFGYAGDITRTFPVNGQFSAPQRDIYQLVLDAQLAVLNRIGPGMTITQAGQIAAEVITQGLVNLGLLSGSVTDNLDAQHYRKYFMHGIGHFLGLDVHDVGDYRLDGEDRPLQPGMVITIEPGIYIAPDADVDEKYQGIGVRIEDNLVITATGADVITSDVPKTIEEIEALMRKS